MIYDLKQLERTRNALHLTVVLCQEISQDRIPEQKVLVSKRLIFKFSCVCFFPKTYLQVQENYPCVPKIFLN